MNIQKKLAKSFQLFQEKKYTEAIKNLDAEDLKKLS